VAIQISDVQVDPHRLPVEEAVLHETQTQGDDEVQDGDDDRQQPQPGTGRHPDRRGLPDRGSGGEPAHPGVLGHDEPGPQEADPGDHLGRHPGGVDPDVAAQQRHQVEESVLADLQEQC